MLNLYPSRQVLLRRRGLSWDVTGEIDQYYIITVNTCPEKKYYIEKIALDNCNANSLILKVDYIKKSDRSKTYRERLESNRGKIEEPFFWSDLPVSVPQQYVKTAKRLGIVQAVGKGYHNTNKVQTYRFGELS